MRLLQLHLDSALRAQPALRTHALVADGLEVEACELGPALRLWSRPAAWHELRGRLSAALRDVPEPVLTFTGSGDFHHVTALLVERLGAAGARPLTVVHFDNHPDWVRFPRGVHCGSWVGRVARMAHVARVITVGVCSADVEGRRVRDADHDVLADGRVEVYAHRLGDHAPTLRVGGRTWPTIASLGIENLEGLLLGRIPTDDVYVTIDKDVLGPGEAVTNWDQGRLPLQRLVDCVRAIGTRHRLVGADVVGDWSPPRYAGGLDRWWKRAEALLDQPRAEHAARAAAINDAANRRLLDLYAGLAA